MISMPWSVYPAISAAASLPISSRSRTRTKLGALCAVLAVLLCGAGSIASAQTARFSGAQTTVGSGFSEPLGLAVDAKGDLFVADAENMAIYEIVAVNGSIPASPTIRTLYRPSANPEAIAVDNSGNVYFTTLDVYSNFGNNTVNGTARGRRRSSRFADRKAIGKRTLLPERRCR